MNNEVKVLSEEKKETELTGETEKNTEDEESNKGLVIGLCIGIAMGMTIGLLREDLLIWLTMGIGLGLCFGTAYDNLRSKKKKPADNETEQEKPDDTDKTEE